MRAAAPVSAPAQGFAVDAEVRRWLEGAGAGGRYKVQNGDFVVEELPFGCPPGRGVQWVRVRRQGLDTPEVARRLARAADVQTEDVAWSGLKDRDAVAEQRFTIVNGRRLREMPPGLTLVAAGETREPLRPGALEGNRFVIIVRGGDAAVAAARLAKLVRFPNRFGPQRTANDLPELGRAVLLGTAEPMDNVRKRFALLAWQAGGFNHVLDMRGPRLYDGDLFEEGVATGPLFGARMRWPRGAALALEEGALHASGVGLDELERVARILPGDRRPLAARPLDAAISPHPDGFTLTVTLAPGVYATSLLAELL